MINHNLDFDIDESNLKVIYILDIGKDSDNKNNIILIANNYRDLNKQKQYTEIFDYDWLNESEEE